MTSKDTLLLADHYPDTESKVFYMDIRALGKGFIDAACAGCGNCAAECQFDAITMTHFTDEQLKGQIAAILAERPEEKLLTFACNWCSYAGGDTAGTA